MPPQMKSVEAREIRFSLLLFGDIKNDGTEKQDIKPDGSKAAPGGQGDKEVQKSALASELQDEELSLSKAAS